MSIDRFKDRGAEILFFEQMAKLQQSGGVGNRVCAEMDSKEVAHGVAVVNRIFMGLVCKAIPLLQELETQHALKTNGRTAAFAIRIVGLERDKQLIPRNHFLHRGEELFAPRSLALPCILKLRKSRLVLHGQPCRNFTSAATWIKSAFPW